MAYENVVEMCVLGALYLVFWMGGTMILNEGVWLYIGYVYVGKYFWIGRDELLVANEYKAVDSSGLVSRLSFFQSTLRTLSTYT